MRRLIALALACGALGGCGDSADLDAGTTVGDGGARDAGPTGLDAGPGPDAGRSDGGDLVDAGGPLDAGAGDAGAGDAGALTHIGVVSVANVMTGGMFGQIRGDFVAASDVAFLSSSRTPLPAAPDCFGLVPPPPFVPTRLNAGTLRFDGLILAMHTVPPDMNNEYSFGYAGLFETPGDPIMLTVPGGAIIDAVSATVATPDPASGGAWLLGSTGAMVRWTPGNGDYVLIRFSDGSNMRECQVADSGGYLVPATALGPTGMPSGGRFDFERVIESIVPSSSGNQQLRFRAFTHEVITMR